jgi:hypothetical protein
MSTEPSRPGRTAGGGVNGLVSELRRAPTTVPAFVTLVLLVAWAANQGGYPVTHWAPGALIVLALLALTLWSVRLSLSQVPLAVRIAVLSLAGYTALSFFSILWAAVPGDAWEGADRTLLYLLVFVLFAAWRQRGATAALLLNAWVLAIIALAVFVVLHVRAGNLQSLLPGGRLVYPTGYVNANAAQWLMAFWPALLLARSERLPWALRGVLAGGAVLLAEVALLSQSRGSLYSTPIVLALIFALVPARVRTLALLIPVAAGIGAATPSVLRAGERIQHGGNARAAFDHASVLMLVSAVVVALVVALGAAVESRRAVAPATARRIRKGVGTVAIVTLLAILAGGLVAAGNPVTRVRHEWHTFKAGYGADATGGSRLVSGLGSNRYDFYRVALDEFVAHPVVGIGADNFAQQYLRHGRNDETPRYPHSVELRVLADTGLLGALLALIGLGAALVACARVIRSSAGTSTDPLAGPVAAAALAGFAYWVVHGSFDWLWEFAGLGAPAFALLGLACSLAPPVRNPVEEPATAEPGLRRRWVPGPRRRWALGARGRGTLVAVGALAALAAVVSLAAPWLSQRQVQSAASVWSRSPVVAYSRLKDASRLDPLSDQAYLVAGSIALRLGEPGRADRQFALALGRVAGDAYATLERGAIASSRGDRRAALALFERAAYLDPRDEVTRQALLVVRRGQRVSVGELNRSILSQAQQFS